MGKESRELFGNASSCLRNNYLESLSMWIGSYSGYVDLFSKQIKYSFVINKRIYVCTKIKEENEIKYIFFSADLKEDQLRKKDRKFQRALEKGDKILARINKGGPVGEHISRRGNIILKGEVQTRLSEIVNPFLTGLEGFFILESSVDSNPEKILRIYKGRDKAEKLIRDLKEGTDLRPIRHWSKKAVIGYLLIVFLTNCLIKLTHFLSKNIVVKNLKLLKKFLNNLTVTIIYRKNGLRERVFSNFCEEIRGIFGDKPPNLS